MTAGPLETLCCKPRQGYDPVATAGACRFSEERAQRVIDFFQTALVHIEGEVADKPFMLEDWQKWTLGNLFGWEGPDRTRRYREAFVYVPRKNGKTPLCAGIVLYMTAFDGEPGAQVYSAAADREQASLVYRHAQGMVLRHPKLSAAFKTLRTQKLLEHHASGSTYRALSSEENTKHGLNAHCIIVDELHAHPKPDLVHTLETSTASRRQPLVVHITTADYYRESICNRKYDYAGKVRDGVIDDPSFLPVIYEATQEDDWEAPETWAKANPNLGVSVREDYIRRQCSTAKADSANLNHFLRLHLNVRTNADVAAINIAQWDASGGKVKAEDLVGQTCHGGLDLSSRYDLTAFALYFPEQKAALLWFWIPRRGALRAEKRDRVPYLTWAREGFITTTPDDTIDYQQIEDQIVQAIEPYQMADCAYDDWQCEGTRQRLEARGVEMLKFAQQRSNYNEPCQELERMVVAGELEHFGNPVLRWCASNLMWNVDHQERRMPSKKDSTGRIDGISALTMAMGRALVTEQRPEWSPEVMVI